MPNSVIIIERISQTKEDTTEVFGCLTRLCLEHPEFQYPTIKKLKFPFIHKDFKFKKVTYNQISNYEKSRRKNTLEKEL